AGDNPVKIKDNEGLKIVDASGNPGVLDVGKIKNSNSAVAIDDDLTVNGNSKFVSTGIGYLLNVEEIEVPGHDPTYRTTVNSELYGDKLAKLGKRDDGYHVLEVLPNIGAAGGHAAIRGSFNVVDKLGAGFYEDGDGTAAGVELSDFGIKLPFNRPAKVTISKEGNINTEGNLQIYGEISNPGGFPAGEPVAINDNLQVFGTASVTDYLNVSKIRAYDTVNGTLIFESPLKIGAESPGNGADLTVHGHVKAQGFGTYIEEPSGYKSISDGSTGTQSVACSAGNHISSCGAKIYWWNTFLGYKIAIDTPVTRIYSDPTTNTCYVSAVNNSGNIRYLKASAICLDPNQ
ncbi:hypothetical protein KKG51_02245, partial [Patescibacteria group bacterium]|nr:hypothetical protein [Patescibacteria group bacterium]